MSSSSHHAQEARNICSVLITDDVYISSSYKPDVVTVRSMRTKRIIEEFTHERMDHVWVMAMSPTGQQFITGSYQGLLFDHTTLLIHDQDIYVFTQSQQLRVTC